VPDDIPDPLRPSARYESSTPVEPESYDVAMPPPNTAETKPPDTLAIWYVAREGSREGPLEVDEVRRRQRTGELRPGDLVWREGMADWRPAREVAELAATRARIDGPPPLPASPLAGVDVEGVLQPLNQFFAQPLFYRLTGYAAGGLALLSVMFSIIGLYWSRTWFTSAAVFALAFIVCQAVAAILDRLPTPKADRPSNQ
jgi:hypothetical protein